MNKVILQRSSLKAGHTVSLPGSKSESNRALLINNLCLQPGQIENLAPARDTRIMQELLTAPGPDYDARDAGTVMRFATAWLAISGREATLQGTERMHERPIGILVEALRELGARIEYSGREGYPPLIFLGFDRQLTDVLRIDSTVSSQYISALLMIAPQLPRGLTLQLSGKPVSTPYIDLTRHLMAHFGVKTEQEGNSYRVLPQTYRFRPYTVEADWSAASYWYALFALSEASELRLNGLKPDSWQGDSLLAELMQGFGVQTTWQGNHAVLTRQPAHLPDKLDFLRCPDLAQTFAVLCAALGHSCRFTGLQTLQIKETDRIAALQHELGKFGGGLQPQDRGWQLIPFAGNWQQQRAAIATYHDHRMAMAFAPLAMRTGLTIENPAVVVKSYPDFWNDLQAAGISLEKIQA